MNQDCRCGHRADSTEPHPCHKYNRFGGGRCGKPATQRFYNPAPGRVPYAQVAGVQLKLEVAETWACDECWAEARQQWHGLGQPADFRWKDSNPKGDDSR